MSLKLSRNWKVHYLTHAPKEDRPHQCQYCKRSFIAANVLRKHIEKVHEKITVRVKEE